MTDEARRLNLDSKEELRDATLVHRLDHLERSWRQGAASHRSGEHLDVDSHPCRRARSICCHCFGAVAAAVTDETARMVTIAGRAWTRPPRVSISISPYATRLRTEIVPAVQALGRGAARRPRVAERNRVRSSALSPAPMPRRSSAVPGRGSELPRTSRFGGSRPCSTG
jgi:hypothetical protein